MVQEPIQLQMKVVRMLMHPLPHQNFTQDLISYLELAYVYMHF